MQKRKQPTHPMGSNLGFPIGFVIPNRPGPPVLTDEAIEWIVRDPDKFWKPPNYKGPWPPSAGQPDPWAYLTLNYAPSAGNTRGGGHVGPHQPGSPSFPPFFSFARDIHQTDIDSSNRS